MSFRNHSVSRTASFGILCDGGTSHDWLCGCRLQGGNSMSIRNLDRLFRPHAVAVIGASARHNAVGAVALRNLVKGGFRGPVLPINPRRQALEGLKVYPSVKDLDCVPDLALIATPAATLPQ